MNDCGDRTIIRNVLKTNKTNNTHFFSFVLRGATKSCLRTQVSVEMRRDHCDVFAWSARVSRQAGAISMITIKLCTSHVWIPRGNSYLFQKKSQRYCLAGDCLIEPRRLPAFLCQSYRFSSATNFKPHFNTNH